MYGFGYTGIIASMKKLPSGGGNGALTTAWIAATSETDTTIISALNTLETDLTTYGLTAKIKALYPMVGATATKHKFNFMDARDLDVAFRLQFFGGWTHSSTGAKPNGGSYANTFLIPSAVLSLNSAHLSFYSRTPSSAAYCLMGAYTAPTRTGIYASSLFGINANSWVSAISTTGRTYFIGSRTSSTNMLSRCYSITQTDVQASSILPTNSIEINRLGGYSGDYSPNETAFVTIGDGLTSGEMTNLQIAVQAFQTTLSRQV